MPILSRSELFFWGGILIMMISILLGITCILISFFMGRKLKKRLEQEYGEM